MPRSSPRGGRYATGTQRWRERARPNATRPCGWSRESPYYNTPQLTLTDLGTRARPERLAADFNAYLDGFSPNIRAILDQFGFRDRVQRLSEAGVLGTLIRKFTSAGIHLGPDPVRHADGTIMQPGLDDHGMC